MMNMAIEITESLRSDDNDSRLEAGLFVSLGEINRLKLEINQHTLKVKRLEDYLDADIREKACKEIEFGVQDVNNFSFLEKNVNIKNKGLAETFTLMRDSRNTTAHLLLKVDQPNSYKKKAFVRILENANCLGDDLDAIGITSDMIAAVLDVLREELKDIQVPTLKEAEVTNVNKFFKHTLTTIGKGSVANL